MIDMATYLLYANASSLGNTLQSGALVHIS